jgi:hypothetical protein
MKTGLGVVLHHPDLTSGLADALDANQPGAGST